MTHLFGSPGVKGRYIRQGLQRRLRCLFMRTPLRQGRLGGRAWRKQVLFSRSWHNFGVHFALGMTMFPTSPGHCNSWTLTSHTRCHVECLAKGALRAWCEVLRDGRHLYLDYLIPNESTLHYLMSFPPFSLQTVLSWSYPFPWSLTFPNKTPCHGSTYITMRDRLAVRRRGGCWYGDWCRCVGSLF